jgi:uncharacterized protein YndB with AHSA1/START domain
MTADLSLVTRRLIAASPSRLFDAWTSPEQLLSWWGPKGVQCASAEVDATVGGRYRIGNRLPDGSLLYITGAFLVVERPSKLVYTWRVEPGSEHDERVTVRFETRAQGTEVIVVHERILSPAMRDGHASGWEGCLDGLAEHAARQT